MAQQWHCSICFQLSIFFPAPHLEHQRVLGLHERGAPLCAPAAASSAATWASRPSAGACAHTALGLQEAARAFAALACSPLPQAAVPTVRLPLQQPADVPAYPPDNNGWRLTDARHVQTYLHSCDPVRRQSFLHPVHINFFRLRLSLARVLKVVRFRLGCSTLPSVVQRNQGVCRAARVCLCCDQGAIGDEYHTVFECPATRAACAPFAHLFPPASTMLAFSRHRDTLAVAKCILACLDRFITLRSPS
jgi:hypothetical protein